jgi:hypothetical protein
MEMITDSCVKMIAHCRSAGKTKDIVRQDLGNKTQGVLARLIHARINDPGIVNLYLAVFATINDRTP